MIKMEEMMIKFDNIITQNHSKNIMHNFTPFNNFELKFQYLKT